MDRYNFIKNLTASMASTSRLPALTFCDSNKKADVIQGNYSINKNFNPDVDIELTSTQKNVQLFNRNKTKVFTYLSNIIKADNAQVEDIPDSWVGSVFRVKQGQKIRVRFQNQLPRESIIHLHGLHIPPEMDGHPMYAVDNGKQYIYEFKVNNQPGTYWFHPHPDKITGQQVYQGLAGMFIVEDTENNLPKRHYDIPFVIQDRNIDRESQLVYMQENSMSRRIQGFLGNQIFVNGKAGNQIPVSKSTYRFRVLNGSNARIYKLAWSDGYWYGWRPFVTTWNTKIWE